MVILKEIGKKKKKKEYALIAWGRNILASENADSGHLVATVGGSIVSS